jgi:hypothetical protein
MTLRHLEIAQTGTVTTTAEELDISETDIDLTSVDGFPASGAVKIESEIITYAGISGLTLTGCTRGTNGTSAATHADGSTATQTLIDPIATVDGSTTVTITDIGHGAETGDWVIMSGSAAIGGVAADTLNDYYGYEVTVIDANSYSIVVPSAATSTVASGGGFDVTIKYLIGGFPHNLGSSKRCAIFRIRRWRVGQRGLGNPKI